MNRYATTLLNLALLALTALVTLHYDIASIGQFVVLILGGVATFVVPVADAKWAGKLKTGVAIVTALVAAVIPFLVQGAITPSQVFTVILAGVTAFAVELGVQIRTIPTDVPAVPVA